MALAIMAKTPRLNHTKTRLAVDIGDEAALAAHINLVQDTLTRLRRQALVRAVSGVSDISGVNVDITLWVTEVDASTEAWAREFDVPLHQQVGQGLGERMHYILSNLLGRGASSACLVGADCPLIDSSYVAQAFLRLCHADLVFGPAEDGGYGLIGLNQAKPEIFEGISWGSHSVLEESLAVAEKLNLRVENLPTVWDIDTLPDWQRYLAYCRH